MGIIASYDVRFWGLVVWIGALSGLGASAFVWLLRTTERLTYGRHAPTLLAAVEGSPSWRRVAALMLAAVIVVVGLALLGRRSTGGSEVSEAIWLRSGILDFWNALAPAGFAICRWPAAPVQPRPVCPTQQATASRSWSSACAARPVRPWGSSPVAWARATRCGSKPACR